MESPCLERVFPVVQQSMDRNIFAENKNLRENDAKMFEIIATPRTNRPIDGRLSECLRLFSRFALQS